MLFAEIPHVSTELIAMLVIFALGWMFRIERCIAALPFLKESVRRIEGHLGCAPKKDPEKHPSASAEQLEGRA
jgi:hypothetical protein